MLLPINAFPVNNFFLKFHGDCETVQHFKVDGAAPEVRWSCID